MNRYQRRLHNFGLRLMGKPVKFGQPFKLTEAQRAAIPAMLKRMSTRCLAYRLGVSQSTVWRHSKGLHS